MVGKAPGSRRCWARQSHEFYSDPQPWLDTRASGTRTGVPQMLGVGLEDGGGQGEGLPHDQGYLRPASMPCSFLVRHSAVTRSSFYRGRNGDSERSKDMAIRWQSWYLNLSLCEYHA